MGVEGCAFYRVVIRGIWNLKSGSTITMAGYQITQAQLVHIQLSNDNGSSVYPILNTPAGDIAWVCVVVARA